jgi:hypothetical protein
VHRGLDVLVLGGQLAVAVHQQHDLVDDQLGVPAGGPLGAQVGHGVQAVPGEDLLALAEHGAHLVHGAPDPLAVVAPGDAADVRQPGQPAQAAAQQVDAVDADPGRGGRGGQPSTRVRSAVVLPEPGPPSTSRCPPPEARSTSHGPCHCRAGSSSSPNGTRRPRAGSTAARSRTPSAVTSNPPPARSRAIAAGSGGSQIGSTGGAAALIRSTTVDISVGPEPRRVACAGSASSVGSTGRPNRTIGLTGGPTTGASSSSAAPDSGPET